ncbi:ditrans,polycis-undecaprenyl-diphosphate synthase [bacterium BMS3Bbin03]|nr:ditrans,polycis-undecaprenyl-diphosphate synthase [bacterium BMS3Bbin03]
MADWDKKIQARLKQTGNLPKHIAIIMDGNGRWARKRGLPRVAGHREGINSVRDVVEACAQLGIEVLTLYTFSVENWKRPKEEVSYLMTLLVRTIKKEIADLQKNNVHLMIIGHLKDLPDITRKSLEDGIEKTKNNTGLKLVLALSYGGRREILDAVQKIAEKAIDGKISPGDIDEKLFSQHLYTAGLPDPDLLIRTSGELRVSNFLLWQMAYTEMYIMDVYWPDFRRKELYEAIQVYQKRERRFGLVSEQLHPTPSEARTQHV